MINPMTEHNGAYVMEHGRGQGRHSTLDPVRGALDPDVELRRDIVRLERKVRKMICMSILIYFAICLCGVSWV